MKTSREIDSSEAPFFGGETDELILLRRLAILVRGWSDEKDGVSQEDIFSVLKEVEKTQRKTKKRKH